MLSFASCLVFGSLTMRASLLGSPIAWQVSGSCCHTDKGTERDTQDAHSLSGEGPLAGDINSVAALLAFIRCIWAAARVSCVWWPVHLPRVPLDALTGVPKPQQ